MLSFGLCVKSHLRLQVSLFVQNIVLSLRELSLSSLVIIILISVSMITQALSYNNSTFDLKLKKSSFLNACSCIHQHIIHTLQSLEIKLSTLGAYVHKYNALIEFFERYDFMSVCLGF